MGYSPWDLKRVGHGLVTKQQQKNSSHWAKLKVEPHLSFRQDTDVTAPCFRAFAQAVSSACNIFPHSHRTHSKPYYKSLLPWPPFKEAFPDSVINSASYLPLVVLPIALLIYLSPLVTFWHPLILILHLLLAYFFPLQYGLQRGGVFISCGCAAASRIGPGPLRDVNTCWMTTFKMMLNTNKQ